MIRILMAILVATFSCFAVNVQFSEMPAKYRLYPRDAQNLGHVVVQGTVLDAGKDSAVVIVTRNGAPFSRARATLTYQGGGAAFQFSLPIPAELAEYRIQCLINTEVAASVDSIVAGDVFIIGGQSNAAYGISALNEHVRTLRIADSTWGLTTEGAWAPLPQKIIEQCRIPICIINGAIPGSIIASHQKNNASPFSGYYGTILLRATLAKVQNAVKAIFWYQGEWDAGYGADTGYPPQFDQLYRSWMSDYPSVQKIFLVQINTWQTAGSREIREAQRRIAHSYPNIAIMPAIGGLYYNGHGGYTELGNNIYRIVARDIFGSRDTAGIKPPEIQRAYFTSAARNRVALEFDQPVYWNAKKDSVTYLNENSAPVAGFLKDYFAMNDSVWEAADSSWFELGNCRIVLALKAGQAPKTISYMPDWYNLRGCNAMSGPVLWNARKVPALTFTQFPVQAPAVYDTGAITAFNLTAPKQAVSIFERVPLYGIADYAGGMKDTNHYVTFSTPDSFFVRLEPNGFLRGMNPGTARVFASKGNFKDTLLVTVGTGFAPMTSLKFASSQKSVMVGDSTPVDLFGYFSDASGSAAFLLDTLAAFQFNSGILQVGKGWIKALSASDSTNLIALFAGQRCTLQVKTPAVPAFIRRINFQASGDSLKTISGWSIDSGAAYSAGRGYGWITANSSGRHSPLIANYLRATWTVSSGDYQIDCPNGNYIIRVCLSQYLWAEPGVARAGTDTLAVNPLPHAGDGIATDGQIWIADRRITVSSGTGLRLNIYGGIAYLVLIADNGADLNVAAKDNNPIQVQPQAGSDVEKGEEEELNALLAPTAFPNPGNPSTTIRFALPARVSADYTLYDIRGRRVLSEHFQKAESARTRLLVIDFTRQGRNAFASGTYFGRLLCSNGRQYVHSLVMIK